MATETVTLNSGYKMPIVGLGTWQVYGDECKNAVRDAIDAGYRHIDTAAGYSNEEYIGDVLQEYFEAGKLKREDIFITTKLGATFHEEDKVPLCLEQSLKRLKLEYVDLFLIHTPWAFRETGIPLPVGFSMDENNKPAYNNVKLEETWKAMEQCVKNGRAKSIGVSNFSMKQINRICNVAEIKPCTNQVECHIYLQQPKLLKFLKEREMTLIAYAPLGSPERLDIMNKNGQPIDMDDPVVKELAAKYKKTVVQIMLRFWVQKGILVIPKSTNRMRIQQNIQIFDFKLTDTDVAKLEGRDRKLRFFFNIDIFMGHPEYSVEDIKAGE